MVVVMVLKQRGSPLMIDSVGKDRRRYVELAQGVSTGERATIYCLGVGRVLTGVPNRRAIKEVRERCRSGRSGTAGDRAMSAIPSEECLGVGNSSEGRVPPAS